MPGARLWSVLGITLLTSASPIVSQSQHEPRYVRSRQGTLKTKHLLDTHTVCTEWYRTGIPSVCTLRAVIKPTRRCTLIRLWSSGHNPDFVTRSSPQGASKPVRAFAFRTMVTKPSANAALTILRATSEFLLYDSESLRHIPAEKMFTMRPRSDHDLKYVLIQKVFA